MLEESGLACGFRSFAERNPWRETDSFRELVSLQPPTLARPPFASSPYISPCNDMDAYTAGTRFARFQHNVGDFLFIARAALEAAGGYSEYPGNWGIDAELVCRLSLLDGTTPLLLSRSCYILHQPHPEVYNFSRMSLEFPIVHTCLAYENGTMVRSDVARGSRGPHDFGFPAQVFEEEWVFADGSVRRCRGPQSIHC